MTGRLEWMQFLRLGKKMNQTDYWILTKLKKLRIRKPPSQSPKGRSGKQVSE